METSFSRKELFLLAKSEVVSSSDFGLMPHGTLYIAYTMNGRDPLVLMIS